MQFGQSGQPSPDPVSRTAAPVTMIAASRIAAAKRDPAVRARRDAEPTHSNAMVGVGGRPTLIARAPNRSSLLTGRDRRRSRWRSPSSNWPIRPEAARRPPASSAARRTTTTSSPPTTTTTTRSRRGSGQPVTFAFGGDVHFEGGLRAKLDAEPGRHVRADRARALGRGRRDGEPRDRDHRARHPGAEVVQLPGAGHARTTRSRAAGVDVVTMANNHGVDYGAAGAPGHARRQGRAHRWGRRASARTRPRRTRPGPRWCKGQRIAVIGASDVIDDALIYRVDGDGRAGRDRVGEGSERGAAPRRGARGPPDCRHAGRLPALGRGGQQLSDPAPRAARPGAGRRGRRHRRREPQRTGSRPRAVSVPRSSTTGSGTSPSTTRAARRGSPACSTVTATGRDIDTYAWKPARIQGGIPHLLSGAAATQDVGAFDARRACSNLTP